MFLVNESGGVMWSVGHRPWKESRERKPRPKAGVDVVEVARGDRLALCEALMEQSQW